MRKEIDIAELIGRSLKISVDGTRIYDEKSSYLIHPISTNIRIFNCSDMYDTAQGIVVYAADFGTFICPYFRSIEKILKNSGFEKVGDEVISVPYGPYMHSTGSKKSHMEWEKNCSKLLQYSAEITKEELKKSALSSGLKSLPAKILCKARKIPDTGIHIGNKVTFYPMSTSKYPDNKLGKFNTAFDGQDFITIIYSADGETYLVKNFYKIDEILEDYGYIYDFDLLIPNLPE